ncbi:Mu-like prophage protein gp16 [Pseudomonas flavescens]|uniref:Mu-like prophage protein gp16 n=1 Tax=Phytopseudomonas flavescens TaxID=29435 RepID=A0A1G8NX12_9GAMM|nr:regulatory protein GemA [Pseudomonas flavescens]SDI84050.1 Mu-like prophage protein gp16 [Pseudomonas flavescens]
MSAAKQKIQIARRQLGLDDDAYYAILARVAGVKSSTDLTPGQVGRVLAELERLGFKPKTAAKRTDRPKPKPSSDRKSQVGKIEALLAEANRPWSYADAMAQHMFKVERVEWLDGDQLTRMIAALIYNAKRNGRL